MPIQNAHRNFASGLSDPLMEAATLTPSNTADLNWMTRAVMVGQAGNLSVVMAGGMTVTLPALQPGMIYPIRVVRVRATGTTATNIVGLW